MKRTWIIGLLLGFAALSTATYAFEEQKLPPASVGGQSAAPTASSQAKPMTGLLDPGIQVPRTSSGTKIRVPGLGVIGEIPKMDFGLELLYGASQPKGSELERNDGNGFMGRVTVPLKSPR
jgi:hypothetical protein